MKKLVLALALIAGALVAPCPAIIAPGFAQAPPPVPAEPDAERRTRYSGVSGVTTFPVGFDIYGDGTDYTSWIEVWVNGVNQVGNWSLVPTAGSFTTLARPLLAANLNVVFTSGQTGTVDIVGARRPRRTSQLAENQGVPARAFNQVITDLWMTLRETWDRTNDITGRAIMGVPGDQFGPLPAAANRASKFVCFDASGQVTICAATTGSTTFAAGTGIVFSGSAPTVINTNLSAGTGITITGTNPQSIARANIATRAVTGNDTASSADCSRIILASGGFNTLTLPSTASVGAGCEIGYKNNEVHSGIGTARGKKLANFPTDFINGSTILYPGQAGKVVSDGTNWRTSVSPGRWVIPTTAELCWRQDGSDTSDGLGNGTVAADCLAHVQKAVTIIGYQFDGGGYNACNIGIYAGGTSIIGESVSQTGQSIGCYLSVNFRGAVTWSTAGPCWTAGDNAIAIFYMNLGFVPTLACNNTNLAATCQFYGHQSIIYDWFGSFQWNPQGSNDCLVFMDAYGRGTLGLTTMVVGTGAAMSADSILRCDSMCTGLQISGSVAFSAAVTVNTIFKALNGGYINTTAAFSGSPTVSNPSSPRGNARLITNGTTIPGGAPTGISGGQVCATSIC